MQPKTANVAAASQSKCWPDHLLNWDLPFGLNSISTMYPTESHSASSGVMPPPNAQLRWQRYRGPPIASEACQPWLLKSYRPFGLTGARTAWTSTLATIINDLASAPSWEALQRLFLFPHWCLLVPSRAGKSHHRDLAFNLTRRCKEFLALSPIEAWARLPPQEARKPEPRMT